MNALNRLRLRMNGNSKEKLFRIPNYGFPMLV